jgi:hypothetical protein
MSYLASPSLPVRQHGSGFQAIPEIVKAIGQAPEDAALWPKFLQRFYAYCGASGLLSIFQGTRPEFRAKTDNEIAALSDARHSKYFESKNKYDADTSKAMMLLLDIVRDVPTKEPLLTHINTNGQLTDVKVREALQLLVDHYQQQFGASTEMALMSELMGLHFPTNQSNLADAFFSLVTEILRIKNALARLTPPVVLSDANLITNLLVKLPKSIDSIHVAVYTSQMTFEQYYVAVREKLQIMAAHDKAKSLHSNVKAEHEANEQVAASTIDAPSASTLIAALMQGLGKKRQHFDQAPRSNKKPRQQLRPPLRMPDAIIQGNVPPAIDPNRAHDAFCRYCQDNVAPTAATSNLMMVAGIAASEGMREGR